MVFPGRFLLLYGEILLLFLLADNSHSSTPSPPCQQILLFVLVHFSRLFILSSSLQGDWLSSSVPGSPRFFSVPFFFVLRPSLFLIFFRFFSSPSFRCCPCFVRCPSPPPPPSSFAMVLSSSSLFWVVRVFLACAPSATCFCRLCSHFSSRFVSFCLFVFVFVFAVLCLCFSPHAFTVKFVRL